MKKKKIIRWSIIGVIILIVISVILKKMGVVGSSNVVKVTTEISKKRSIIETVTANGKIQPETEVIINPDASGEIIDLFVKEGDQVKKGALLAKIKPDIYESTYDRMEAAVSSQYATLANAKARLSQTEAQFISTELNYKRNQKLWEQKVISDAEWESTTSQYKVAKAEVEAAKQSVIGADFGVKSAQAGSKEAKENLYKTAVYAPMDGTISKLTKEKGERVSGASQFSAGTEIMRIADLQYMEVRVNVNENDVVKISLGDTSTVEVDAYPNRKFQGVVTSIANSATLSATGTFSADQVTNFEVKIRILPGSYVDLIPADKPYMSPFRPGMSATVEIITEKVENVLCVPVQSVTTRDDTISNVKAKVVKDMNNDNDTQKKKTKEKNYTEYVFLYENGKAMLRKVKTGVQDNLYIQILEGIAENAEVISGPFNVISKELMNGAKVEKVDKSALYADPKK
jgi:HlyD family secretion protein